MGNLTEHVILNKWDDDINTAIIKVGGDTSGSEGLPDYAGIIESQLVSNEAVGKGIYQDFLYVDPDNNETSIYPWDGEPTTSSNAVEASALASSIKQLYSTMSSIERFNILLVDEIPKKEINLSSVYLIKKPNEDPAVDDNVYYGCYFIKAGKQIKQIDIPDFTIDLEELFFLTRAEYKDSIAQYMAEIEEMLKKKFGKYWGDDGFSLDEMLDAVVAELKAELQAESKSIIERMNAKIDNVVEELTDKMSESITEIDERLNSRFDQLESDISEDIIELRKDVEERVKISDLVSLNDEINELQ